MSLEICFGFTNIDDVTHAITDTLVQQGTIIQELRFGNLRISPDSYSTVFCIQQTFSGPNIDASFTTTVLNSFLSPLEKHIAAGSG